MFAEFRTMPISLTIIRANRPSFSCSIPIVLLLFCFVFPTFYTSSQAAPSHPFNQQIPVYLLGSDLAQQKQSSETSKNVEDVGPALANATQNALSDAEAILSNYTSIVHGLAIPVGLAATFFGYFLLTPVLFIAAFIIGGGASFVVVSTILSDFSPSDDKLSTPTSAWISIGAMLFGGALFGFIAMRALPIGMFAIGASLGVIFSSSLRTSLIPQLFPNDPQTAFIVTAVVLGLLLGLLALFFQKQMLIFSTSYGGAFAAAFGIGHFTGHVLTVKEFEDLEKGKFVDGWIFLYLGLALLLGTCGMFFQFWISRDREMPEYAPYDRRRRYRSRNRSQRYQDPYWDDMDEEDDAWDERYEQSPRRPPPRRGPPPPPPDARYEDNRDVNVK